MTIIGHGNSLTGQRTSYLEPIDVSELSEYDYELPPELIAQHPADRRDHSRLLVIDRSANTLRDAVFHQVTELLRPGDLLVANESRVIPARVWGHLTTGGKVELLFIREREGGWETMTRPARKLKVGTTIDLPGDVTGVVRDVFAEGRRLIQLEGVADVTAWLASAGRAPVPPYIHEHPSDPERYQTVYSRHDGSVAAPTAGLHFTTELLDRLNQNGTATRFLTLHVGPGTFKPITEDRIEDIRLEPERASIPQDTVAAIEETKRNGGRIVAVGTTTVRTLEGVAHQCGELRPWDGPVDLFIRPGFDFRVVDALITNFHLPKSSLLMLVSAFAGREQIRRAYAHAVAAEYRFYSFGDAMLIV